VLTDEHRAVETMIARGIRFEHIEDYINALSLPSEQLGALWLLAWAEATDRVTRRRIVAQALAFAHAPFEAGGPSTLLT
jgi:hypothetical protein